MRPAGELLPQARAVLVCTPDVTGRLVGKRRRADDWPDLRANGLAMPDFHLLTGLENRPLPGFAVAGGARGFRNGRLLPDENAAFVSPADPGVPHVIADALTAEGEPVAEAPRAILRRQVERLRRQGIDALFASELEFYLFRQSFREAALASHRDLEPLYHRHGDNDVLVSSLAAPFCASLEEALARCGIVVDQVQGEGGAGQFEVNVRPAPPLAAADDHVVFKHVAKALAHAAGQSVTFLAKPFAAEAGSGGHVHLSLRAPDGGIGTAAGGLSPFGGGFVAGLLAFSPELTLLHAPYANSYRRLVPGAFTPLRSTWGWDNRSAMVRIVGGGEGLRIEMRLPGADVNPYLSYAAIVAAGLAGVEAGLSPPPPKSGEAEPAGSIAVPADLTEALARFEASALARQAFGEAVHEHLCRHGRHELAATRRAVSDWEVARGFEGA